MPTARPLPLANALVAPVTAPWGPQAAETPNAMPADLAALMPLAHDVCADNAISVANIRALVRSHVVAHKTTTSADWFGQTEFSLCQRHVDADGDQREDSVYLTIWQRWEFYLAAEQVPVHQGLAGQLRRLTAALTQRPQPLTTVLTIACRPLLAPGPPGAWRALPADMPTTTAPEQPFGAATEDPDSDAAAWAACQQAWRGVVDYVRKAEGQHRARYPLYTRLQAELTAARIEALTEHPLFTEHYNDWWDPDRCGFWDGDLWVGARQPCMHAGEPWGRVLKFSAKNGSEAPGDAPDDAHALYQIDVDEARAGPPLLHITHAPRQSEERAELQRCAADHIARLLHFFGTTERRWLAPPGDSGAEQSTGVDAVLPNDPPAAS
jgi:hypothetical protein